MQQTHMVLERVNSSLTAITTHRTESNQ